MKAVGLSSPTVNEHFLVSHCRSCISLLLSLSLQTRAACGGTSPSVSLCVVNEVWPLRQQKSTRQLYKFHISSESEHVCVVHWNIFLVAYGNIIPPMILHLVPWYHSPSFPCDLNPNDIPVWLPSSQPHDEWATLIYIIQLELEEYKWRKASRTQYSTPRWLVLTQTWLQHSMKVFLNTSLLGKQRCVH